MRQHFLLVFFVKFLDKVDGIVGVKVLHELLGNVLVGHILKQAVAVVLIKFHQGVGSSVTVKVRHHILRLLKVHLLYKFGNVGRVQLFEFCHHLRLVVFLYEMSEFIQKFL